MNLARLARLMLYWICGGLLAASVATAAGWIAAESAALPVLFGAGALAGAGAAIWVDRALDGRRTSRGRRAVRATDLVAFNLLGALLLVETTLHVAERVAPAHLLFDRSVGVSRVLAQRRCWEAWTFRYPCNSERYPDEEFFEPTPDDYVVALIADSFGVGAVPWSHNFATLAERELRAQRGMEYERVAIHNFGVSGINLPGYRHLLDTEVLGRPFAQVVLCVFVGNDFGDLPQTQRPLQRALRIQGWLAPQVARRGWRVASRMRRPLAGGADVEDAPAFLQDPALEEPSFSRREFLSIELHRMRYTLKRGKASQLVYERALEQLDAFHDALGSRLLVVVIPDEYQVNDELWNSLLPAAIKNYAHALAPGQAALSFERGYPQRRLRGWAKDRGARLLDLLPALREAERSGRTYHLRDTHWNAHGNRVAGRELANALLAYRDG